MRRFSHLSRPAGRQAGISLVEIMVGLVIGLIATAVIFQTFSVAEGFKRNTTSAGDAQQSGLFATFTLALELANAGNGLSSSAQTLAACPDTKDVTTTMRPVPVVIASGAKADDPDSFVVNYSSSASIVYPAIFTATAKIGEAYQVQSPTGFKKGDMVVAIDEGANACERTKITADVLPPDGNGIVTITHSGASRAFPASSVLFNMGPWGRSQRVRYEVVNGTLRSVDLTPTDPKGAVDNPPVPLASNVVNMKVQYGIDSDGDGILDTWVSGGDLNWQPADMLAANLTKMNQVKAVRIGFIVRSAQYERDLGGAMPKDGSRKQAGDFNWVLFDCATHDNACPGRLTGTIAADANGGGYRHRVFETVVPLRNQLWNRQL